ncbi:Stress responsive A/B Barrel Domain-containing protein [Pseudomonas amygdali pv. eriobotryae]|uniref:Stress responsive A/B Barrel Domain-containing protein n=1 Tax=Pseudomonas amygdali pv. eriobotryae TaxID=129137 RepID=A0A0P9QU91_PSEA0|nr:Dabb family protein [Pseudomonas amygdali]KPX38153.1 Stress responsive A/B Barrel Domain-containing protein [Pseudomonas amygdali pv. eriobotryae]KWS74491.1 stress responsive protein [Pseudomonas amygdali pv. eriobotryae]RML95590.1 Stress responsive A/B Barrel Domain-containing protein [Pseudomonas amygdali pv. eriobotryae]RMO55144.1 Stress responsive A/B Barrel Domain-containing protein [Pseudomonas amygdali pv. eriobotryae]GFZ71836.1 stress responsive protein [Pseudomonas amygdali pv. eri
MIKHIVMWNLAGETPQANRKACMFLKACFEGLAGRIPGLIKIEVGVDISRIDYACDVVLYTEFESEQALANYAVHPEHLRLKQELGALRVARHQVDYVVP